MCRQIEGCDNSVSEALVGSKGTCQVNNYTITGANAWKFRGQATIDPYVQEHTDLIASIRDGKPLNELKKVAESTLTAIMGREAGYTGKVVTWDDVVNQQTVLAPPSIDLSATAADAAGADARRDHELRLP